MRKSLLLLIIFIATLLVATMIDRKNEAEKERELIAQYN